MPTYSYKARDETGKLVEGAMSLPDERAVALKLAESGYFVSQITPLREKPEGGGILIFGSGVSTDDIIMFSQQLATMSRAGLTLTNSINILLQQTENPRFKAILRKVYSEVSAGAPFTNALSKFPKVFSELYINTVKVGEESGQLPEVLDRVSAHLTRQAELRRKIKAALSYPMVIIGLAIMVIIFILTFVLPRFVKIFAEARVELPLPTRIVLGASNIMMTYWYLIIIGVVGLIVGAVSYIKTPIGRRNLDRLKLRLPLLGPLFMKSAVIRITRPLEILSRTGVNVVQSCEIVRKSVGNVVLEETIARVRDSVQQGGTMSQVINESGRFPPMVGQMMAVGEETGSLDTMLAALSESYERQLEYSTNRLITVIEPLLLTFLAGVVALLAVSVYLPIFSMMKVLGAQ